MELTSQQKRYRILRIKELFNTFSVTYIPWLISEWYQHCDEIEACDKEILALRKECNIRVRALNRITGQTVMEVTIPEREAENVPRSD
jgi:hypothetical protein